MFWFFLRALVFVFFVLLFILEGYYCGGVFLVTQIYIFFYKINIQNKTGTRSKGRVRDIDSQGGHQRKLIFAIR